MRATLLAVLAVISVLSASASAAPIINVGSHDLLENTSGETIQLYVTGTDQVTAFNLKAQIGDGTGKPGVRPKGRLGFLGHHNRIEFRNLRIKEL